MWFQVKDGKIKGYNPEITTTVLAFMVVKGDG